jgi:hypothetical protein
LNEFFLVQVYFHQLKERPAASPTGPAYANFQTSGSTAEITYPCWLGYKYISMSSASFTYPVLGIPGSVAKGAFLRSVLSINISIEYITTFICIFTGTMPE